MFLFKHEYTLFLIYMLLKNTSKIINAMMKARKIIKTNDGIQYHVR